MKNYTYNLSGYIIQVFISERMIEISITDKSGKEYPSFIANYNHNISAVPKEHIDLLIWILFYGYGINPTWAGNAGTFDVPSGNPPVDINTQAPGKNTILSYSGGADSTAAYVMLPSKPVMIVRPHNEKYMKNQIRMADQINSDFIETTFELIRKDVFGKGEGFNIGIGYISVLFPLLHVMKANTISLGVVWDDVCFSYNNELKYVAGHYGRIDYVKNVLLNYGIRLSFPTAGTSEVITSMIAKMSGIKYSSCHYTDKDHCGKCYKCLRKLGFQNKQLDMGNPDVKNMMYKFINKKPLKMAASTVFGMQTGGYKIDKYDQVDVSFCTRYHESVIRKYNPSDIAENIMEFLDVMGIKKSLPEDEQAIHEFVKIVNKEEFYE